MHISTNKFRVAVLVFLLFSGSVFAQNSFDITIKLDSSINPAKMHYQYENGKRTVFLPDTFGKNRTVTLHLVSYSKLAWLNVSYADSAKNDYGNDFFLPGKPAKIGLYYEPGEERLLKYKFIKNAIRVYDTTDNKILRELWSSTKNENAALNTFFSHNKGKLNNNDTVTREFKKLYKRYLENSMEFLKRYPGDYFSFWYFRNQLVQLPNGFFKSDTAFLKEQLAYLNAVFPAKFVKSNEGENLEAMFRATLNPPRTGDLSPLFSIASVDGQKIKLTGLKGKYVLLDFWATWCGPCMAEIPFIKDIRKKYPANKLVIIGMSQDRDRKAFTDAIKKEGMNWPHFYDDEGDMSRLFGVNYFPTLFLINPEGKIVYRSDLQKEDKDTLPPVLIRFLD